MADTVLLVPGEETEVNLEVHGIHFSMNATYSHVIISSVDSPIPMSLELSELRMKLANRNIAPCIRNLYKRAEEYAFRTIPNRC